MALGDSADDTLPASVVATAAARAALPVVARSCYEVLSEHARGGLGRILRARDLRTGRLVAIKEMLDGTPDAATRFAREALVTANLQHPAIVPVYEVGRWPEGEPFYAMKLVDGRSLDAELQDARTLRERLALVPRLIDVAEAIAYAHGQGVIHRDLKPANVLVGSYGETVVIDWGLARRSGDPEAALSSSLVGVISGAVTLVGDVVGTPAYMPPEQARGEEVDARADVYALGAMLYYLLGGRVPYAGARTAAEVLTQILLGPPQPLVELEPELPPELLAIVAKAMAPSRDDRYASARECAADLRRYQTGQLVGAHAYSAWQLIRRRLRRHRAVVTMAAVLVLGLAATGALAVRGITRERNVARAERARADHQRELAEARSNHLIVEQARGFITRDPTQALAWLKQLPAAAREWAEVRSIASDAREQGVARWVLRGHVGSVNDVTFTPDGRLVSVGADATLRIWEPATGTARVFRDRAAIESVEVTADGAHAVTFGEWDPDVPSGRSLRVWSLTTGEVFDVPRFPGRNDDAVLSPDGRSLAVMTCRGSVHLIDLATRVSRDLRPATGRREGEAYCPNSMAFSSDGALLAAESGQAAVDVIDVARATVIASVGDPQDGSITDIEFVDGDTRLWLLTRRGLSSWRASGGDRRTLFEDQAGPRGVVRTADARIAVVAERDGTARARSIDDGVERVVIRHDGVLNALIAMPDGRAVVSGGADHLVWTAAVDGTWRHALRGHDGIVNEVAVSPDGRWLASSAADGTVRVWQLDELRRSYESDAAVVESIAVTPDGAAVYFTSRLGCVERWTLGGAARTLRPCEQPEAHPNLVALSADGQVLVASRVTGGFDVWRGGDGPPRTFGGDRLVAGLALAADGARLAVVDTIGTVEIFELHTGVARTIATPSLSERGFRAIAIAGDGARVLWAEAGGIGVAELPSGQTRHLKGGDGEVRELVLTAEGRTAFSTDSAGAVTRWDLSAGTAVQVAQRRGAQLLRLAPDGAHLAFADDDDTVLVASASPGVEPRVFVGHAGTVNDLAFSPDGLTLASASDDTTTRLWDLTSGVSRVLAHHEYVYAVAFTPDSRRIVTATRLGTISMIADDLPRDEAALRAYLATATNLEVVPPDATPH
jgi:WD40 repeat protein